MTISLPSNKAKNSAQFWRWCTF